jgi:hypothetical protein
MSSEELGVVVRFLRENKVRVEAGAADAFDSGRKAYSYGGLLHPFARALHARPWWAIIGNDDRRGTPTTCAGVWLADRAPTL